MTYLLAPQTADYFLPASDAWWQWQEQGEVITWRDGSTITFRDELDAILEHLAPQGWPPLGSLVLLLAACRESWRPPEFDTSFVRLLNQIGASTRYSEEQKKILNGLERVRQLPSDLRNSLPARRELAAMVFESSLQKSSHEVAKQLLAQWRQNRAEEMETTRGQVTVGNLLAEMFALLSGLAKIDERTLRLRMETSLEEIPLAAPVEPPEPQEGTGLLDSLLDDPELCGVAQLARQLLAVVSLPRPLSARADLAEGGISDITNRGPLDRLLLSELAHDETTLAVRVALNEALYHRRETPPGPPPRSRLLLLDSGLRMWGVPRALATAVSLALAESPQRNLETRAFRAGNEGLVPIDLQSREGLIAHLAALETSVHPAAALPAFVEHVQKSSTAAEAVLITCEEALADPKFQQELARCHISPLYVVSVSRQGEYRLVVRTLRGSRVLREAMLDVDRLLNARPRRSKARSSSAEDLPAILHVTPFPLLLSVPLEYDRSWHVAMKGVLSYTRDGRLLFWTHPEQGARQIAQGLPQGKLFACENSASNGKTFAVIGKHSPRGMRTLEIDLAAGSVVGAPLRFLSTPELPVAIYRSRVLVRTNGNLAICNATTGELLSQVSWHGTSQQIGRIIQRFDGNGWWVEAINAAGESFPVASAPASTPYLAAFTTEGVEGIVTVDAQGQLTIHADHTSHSQHVPAQHPPRGPLRVAAISRDGRRFVLEGRSTREMKPCLVDVLTGKAREITSPYEYEYLLEPVLREYVRPRVLRTRFRGIGIDASGNLTLVGQRRNLSWAIEFDARASMLRFASNPTDCLPQSLRNFESEDARPLGFSLRLAQFPSGACAWLDSRGLLHLRAPDNSVPELTLVLTERALAGWLSDGRVFGPAYYHNQNTWCGANEVYREVLQPFASMVT